MINHYLQSQSSEFQVDIIGILGTDIIDDWKLFDGTGIQFFS
jgi:hypothetical protein